MNKFLHAITILIAFFVFCGFQSNALANQQAIDNGVSWLAAQQQEDGRISLSSDLSHAFQATTEALITLEELGRLDAVDVEAAKVFIQKNTYWNTEFLARALLAGVETDAKGISLLEILQGYQNKGGGFGDFLNYETTPYDSAWALLALVEWGNASETVMAKVVSSLVNQINTQDIWNLYLTDSAETSGWVFMYPVNASWTI